MFVHLAYWSLGMTVTALTLCLFALRYRVGGNRPRRGDKLGATPMRVMFVHRDLSYHGGIPRCLLYLARACDQMRIDYSIASLIEPSEQMVAAFKDLEIEPQCFGDKGILRSSLALTRAVRLQQIDIVVATTFRTYLCAKLAAWRTGVCVVFWFHAVRGVVDGYLRGKLRDLLSKHDGMIFVSRAVMRTQLPANHRGPAQVIYNGVEKIEHHPQYEPYPRAMRAQLGVPDDALVLIYTAEFVAWKDHATLVAAAHELVKRGVRLCVLLVGSGRIIEQVKAMASRGPAASAIQFLGPRSDARRLLGIADMYVHPSRGEGFGLAVVEAMLAGKPVIVARDGAFPEYVSHDETGLLICPGDAIDLADAVQSLAADPRRAEAMGQAARAYCSTHFDIDHFADAVTLFLEDTNPAAARKHDRAATAPSDDPQAMIAPAGSVSSSTLEVSGG